MAQFRLLKQTRQMTEYSCGASALQAVLSYWGRDVDEAELMRIIGTDAEVGTFPENIVRGARTLGFEAVLKENATIDDLERSTVAGRPVIALAQVWRSEKDTPASAADEWDSGHYIVVLSVDEESVYFQDPYIRMGKGFVPRTTFDEHWHQIMGGSKRARSSKLMHVAIFIRGDESERRAVADVAAANEDIDLGDMGSMNVLRVRFTRPLLPYDFLDELRGLNEGETIRPDAFVLLRKDADGRLSAMQGGRLENGKDITGVNVLIAALATGATGGSDAVRASAQAATWAAKRGDFGLSAGRLRKHAERLLPGHSEIIVLVENVWERRFRDVAERYGGAVEDPRFLPSAAIAKLGRALRKERL